jgi:hypothetical protein
MTAHQKLPPPQVSGHAAAGLGPGRCARGALPPASVGPPGQVQRQDPRAAAARPLPLSLRQDQGRLASKQEAAGLSGASEASCPPREVSPPRASPRAQARRGPAAGRPLFSSALPAGPGGAPRAAASSPSRVREDFPWERPGAAARGRGHASRAVAAARSSIWLCRRRGD